MRELEKEIIRLRKENDNLRGQLNQLNAEFRVPGLIHKLGSKRFHEREDASEALGKLGGAALVALETATSNSDLEVRKRARALLNQLGPYSEQYVVWNKLGHPYSVSQRITVRGDGALEARIGDIIAIQTPKPPAGNGLISIKCRFDGAAQHLIIVTPEGADGGTPVKGKSTATIYVLASKAGQGTVRVTWRWAERKNASGPSTFITTLKLHVAK